MVHLCLYLVFFSMHCIMCRLLLTLKMQDQSRSKVWWTSRWPRVETMTAKSAEEPTAAGPSCTALIWVCREVLMESSSTLTGLTVIHVETGWLLIPELNKVDLYSFRSWSAGFLVWGSWIIIAPSHWRFPVLNLTWPFPSVEEQSDVCSPKAEFSAPNR